MLLLIIIPVVTITLVVVGVERCLVVVVGGNEEQDAVTQAAWFEPSLVGILTSPSVDHSGRLFIVVCTNQRCYMKTRHLDQVARHFHFELQNGSEHQHWTRHLPKAYGVVQLKYSDYGTQYSGVLRSTFLLLQLFPIYLNVVSQDSS